MQKKAGLRVYSSCVFFYVLPCSVNIFPYITHDINLTQVDLSVIIKGRDRPLDWGVQIHS